MMNDTVREELQSKITTGTTPRIEARPAPIAENKPTPPRPVMIAPPPARRVHTANLAGPKTSQTLVGFQNKNASLPDWRLQLQNAVQQRRGMQNITVDAPATGTQFPTHGAAALKAEAVQRVEAEPEPQGADPRVANAMRRIEESRKAFSEAKVKQPPASKPAPVRPFGVVSPSANASAAAAPALIIAPPKPKLVNPAPIAEKRDTNKLPPIETVQKVAAVTAEPAVEFKRSGEPPAEFAEIKRIRIRAENSEIETTDTFDTGIDEIEDLAPFSMRFSAGLFDLIIGGFAGMLLLSPIAFTRSDWFTTAGLLTLAGTCAIVMFLYMTVCLGFFGKTMGMRLFSLELVDAVENEYPTLQQAAVNSCVFIFSLLFAGAGFLTVFFNEERRALHDLLSGTIIVREF